MRHIRDRLYGFLEFTVADFIKHQRQNDRGRKAKHDSPHIQEKRIFDDPPKVRPLKEINEMLETDPVAFGKSKQRLIILKGDENAPHRTVTENKEPSDHRNGQLVDKPVLPQILFDRLSCVIELRSPCGGDFS
ncbi:hypothetical protein D3C74_380910 [compost metagenome]